jgi:dTDP-4-dehydrorhamnose 3,5-epimerase-like enzyme
VVLDDQGADERGESYSVPLGYLELLGAPKDVHVASIRPGHVRGNHYHVERHELIMVLPHDAWSLHWDAGADTQVSTRVFQEVRAVAIAIPTYCSHAIRNDGQTLLWLIAASDGLYDPASPDVHRRVVVAPGNVGR